MPDRCERCAAPGNNCQELFDRALSLEFNDPGYGAVHHLTVTAFMLQHNRYSHSGWLASRGLLEAFVASTTPPGETERRLARAAAASEGSISRGNPYDQFDAIRWTCSIGM